MEEQFIVLRRLFNKLGSRWVTAGDTAASIHAAFLGVKFRTPRSFEFIIGKHNKEKFYNAITSIGYEFMPMKSGRRNLLFEKRGKIPISIQLAEVSPRSVSYNATPIQPLHKLSNVTRLVNYKKKVDRIVNNLMRNVNLNVN
jgi:hypothetical protein